MLHCLQLPDRVGKAIAHRLRMLMAVGMSAVVTVHRAAPLSLLFTTPQKPPLHKRSLLPKLSQFLVRLRLVLLPRLC